MVRVTNGLQRQRRHKKFRDAAKGFRLGRKNVYKQVRNALTRKGEHEYRCRKEKKRTFRKLWIERLSAVVRSKGSSYSRFIGTMTANGVQLDRKVLSNVAVAFPEAFDAIYKEIVA